MKRPWRLAMVHAAVSICFCALIPHSVSSLSVTDPRVPPPLANADIIVTAFPLAVNPSFIELYNQSGQAVSLTGRSADVTFSNGVSVSVDLGDGYLLPESYFALGQNGMVQGADRTFALDAAEQNERIVAISVTDLSGHQTVQIDGAVATHTKFTWAQRKSGASGKGITMAQFTEKDGIKDPVLLRGNGLYRLPVPPQSIRIVEILPQNASCAPGDMSATCGDYIKIQNYGTAQVDLSSYRLRSDSGTSQLGNTFSLPYLIEPGEYLTITTRDDGQKMSLTNSGGYVWLEDAEGVTRYDETIVEYADASSSTKQGWSWALFDSQWLWTSTPQPDMANLLTQPSRQVASTSTELGDCPVGKYRNPETNRCRNIEEAIATLTACDEGEYRNPETNRCRKIATSASTSLVPCEPGQERNPATNRCKNVTRASATLKPCEKGYERNAATNRCKKVAGGIVPMGASITPVTNEGLSNGYWFAGVAALGAVGYALYEWRTEIMKQLRRFIPTSK